MFMASSVFAGPGYTTYQAKIIKPDGLPLEANVVNFKFTILNPAGTCILYSETYSSVNMASTGGVISFSLGSGVKTYPVSATTFENVFSNITPALACDVGGPGIFNPGADDIRKIVMQFHDGNGWQTLPAMSINAVPYAMYANDSQKLNGKIDSDFVQVSTLPMACGVSEALRFNGAAFSCIAVGGAGDAVTSGSVITALGYTPANGASVTTLTSNISVVSSTVTSLSSTVSGISTTVSGLSASLAVIVSSRWSASGTSINYSAGNVGVGTSNPSHKFEAATEGADNYVASTAYGSGGGNFITLRARGSASAPSSLLIGDGIGSFGARGYGSTGWSNLSRAKIQVFTSENWSDDAQGARMYFYTTANGTSNAAYRMGIDQSGHIGIGVTSPGSRLVVKSSGTTSATSALNVTDSSNISKLFVRDDGNVGIGTAVPTARLHIATGTSMLAPFKFSSGTLLTSPQSGAMEYDGFDFYLTDSIGARRAIATGSNAGTIDDASFINSTGNITMTPVGSVVVSSTTTSINSQTGALVVNGGLGVGGNIFSSGTIITSSNIQGASITAVNGMIAPYIAGSTLVSGSLTLDSTTDTTKGRILLAPNGGNIGIGTSSPVRRLQINGSTSSDTTFAVERNDGASNVAAFSFNPFGSVTNGEPKLAIGVGSSLASGSVKMTITASGHVGIGTSAPNTKLDLGSNFNDPIGLSNGYPNKITLWSGGALNIFGFGVRSSYLDYFSQGGHKFHTGYGGASGAEALSIIPSGRVGIGTSAPQANLEISGTAVKKLILRDDQDGLQQASIISFEGATDGAHGWMGFASTADDDLSILAQGANGDVILGAGNSFAKGLRIKGSSGNIGIGTSTPNTLLQIGPSGSAATANLSFVGSYLSTSGQAQYAGNWASAGYWGIGPATNSTDNNIRLGNIATASGTWSGTQNLNLLLGGNLGIGQTNPVNSLDVLKTSGDLTARFKADSVDSDVSMLMQNDVQTWKIQNRAGYSDAFVIEDTTASTNPFVMKKSTGFLGLGNVTNPGYQLEVSGTVQITSGSALRIGAANICTSAGCTSSSDLRLKQNIQPLDFSLEKLLSLKGVQYDWKDKAVYGDKHQIGFIAQELEKVFPEVVYTDKETGLKTVSYGQLIAPLVEAFKKLFEKTQNNTRAIASLEEKDNVKDQQIKALTLENARKDQELREMKERLDRIEKALNKK